MLEQRQLEQQQLQQAEPEIVEVLRYPTMEAPDQVKAGESLAVMVSLTESLITQSVEIISGKTDGEGRLSLDLPEQADKPWEIDVVLSASGFEFSSPNKGKIFLPKNGDSSPAMFELTALQSDSLAQDRRLYATFWYEGRYLARVQKPISVVNQSLSKQNNCYQSADRASEMASVIGAAEAARLASNTSADLTIYMRRDWDSCNAADYHITIVSPYLEPSHERVTLAENIEEWLIPKFKQFSISGRSLPGTESDSELDEDDLEDDWEDEPEFVTRDYMVGFGQQLYRQFAPQNFKRAFTQLQAKLGEEFDTIQIYTDEPAIPWELMVPERSDQMLNLSHAVGRWIIPKHRSDFTVPQQTLQASRVFLATPEYEGNLKLYSTAAESKYINELFDQKSERIAARYSPVKALLTSATASIIHYSGHGYAQRDEAQNVVDYGLILEDERLKALNWRGILANQTNPSLIFFNACEVGLAEKSAGFVDGWSQALTDTGSRGFISALWELGDRGAAQFSKRFYDDIAQQLESGSQASVADAIKNAKQSFNRTENPTDLAYVFYGDVGLKVSLAGD